MINYTIREKQGRTTHENEKPAHIVTTLAGKNHYKQKHVDNYELSVVAWSVLRVGQREPMQAGPRLGLPGSCV